MRGILHRDLKPANILIDAQGHPHITDFGLAKLLESDVELTASGAILGTPAYMSPEQAAGRRGAMTLATDVYGLGAIFYALLTGKAPFGGDSVIETLDAVRTRPPEVPRKRNAAIPHDLELICLKCLEKNPARSLPHGRGAGGRPAALGGGRTGKRPGGRGRRAGGEMGPPQADAGRRISLGLLRCSSAGLGGAAVWQWRAAARARDVAATAKEATGRLNVQLRRALDEQKQLADQLKKLANKQTTLAERAETSRDSLVAMISDLINQIDSDPNQALSAAVLKQKLNEIIEKTKIEFEPFRHDWRLMTDRPTTRATPASRCDPAFCV